MALVRHDFDLVAGQRFPVTGDGGTIALRDSTGALIDLTGYTARLKAREYPGATTALVTLIDGFGIALGGVLGTVNISFTAVQTSAMGDGVFPYDMLLIPGTGETDAFVFLAGFLRVEPMMARA